MTRLEHQDDEAGCVSCRWALGGGFGAPSMVCDVKAIFQIEADPRSEGNVSGLKSRSADPRGRGSAWEKIVFPDRDGSPI